MDVLGLVDENSNEIIFLAIVIADSVSRLVFARIVLRIIEMKTILWKAGVWDRT